MKTFDGIQKFTSHIFLIRFQVNDARFQNGVQYIIIIVRIGHWFFNMCIRIFWRQSIYVLATILLANHYHNISSKTFILRDRYKRFSSNGLQENRLLRLCVLSEKRTVKITTVLCWDNTHKLYKRFSCKLVLENLL